MHRKHLQPFFLIFFLNTCRPFTRVVHVGITFKPGKGKSGYSIDATRRIYDYASMIAKNADKLEMCMDSIKKLVPEILSVWENKDDYAIHERLIDVAEST